MWRAAVFDKESIRKRRISDRSKFGLNILLSYTWLFSLKMKRNYWQLVVNKYSSATERLNLLVALAVFRDPKVGGVACIFVRIFKHELAHVE